MPMDLPDADFVNLLDDLMRQCREAMRKRALMPRRGDVPEQEPGPLFRDAGEGAGE